MFIAITDPGAWCPALALKQLVPQCCIKEQAWHCPFALAEAVHKPRPAALHTCHCHSLRPLLRAESVYQCIDNRPNFFNKINMT